MIETIGELQLTDQWWDCDCKQDYIKPASIDKCPVCGARREDHPDSRVNEVKQLIGSDAEV